MTPNELISIASNNLGDGGFVVLNREEYLQFTNDVAHDLWSGSKACHVVREYVLPSGESYFDLAEDDIIEFVSIQIRAKDTAVNTPEEPIFRTDTAVYPQQEKPPLQNIEEGLGLWQNVGNTSRRQHLTPEFRNGRYRIHSPQRFSDGQVLTLHLVVTSPHYIWLDKAVVDPTDPNVTVDLTDAERIWEPFRNLFIEGVTWRAARRMINFTKDNRTSIWQSAQQLYFSKYLPDAIHFVHSLKDSASVLHVEPFRYLDE